MSICGKAIPLLAALLVSGFSALAAAPNPPPAAPAASPRSTGWLVNKQTSKIEFKSKFTGIAFGGTFKTWDAQINFDPAALAQSKVTVTIDLASAVTGDATRDEALPSTEWFDIAKFPRANVTSRAFRHVAGNRYEMTGDLTLHGVTKPITLPFTLAIANDQATAQGTLVLLRNAYNVGTGYFADTESVPYEVEVLITVNARRAP